MRRIILLASAFLLIPASAFAAFAPGDQVTVQGTVTSYDGRDATVLAQRPSGTVVVDINETDSTGNVRRYAAANLKPRPTPTPSPSPTPTPSSTPTPSPTDTPSPTPTATPTDTPTPTPTATPTANAPTLTPVDGGATWNSSHGLPGFPVAVWGSYNHTQANLNLDAAIGINTYVWVADSTATNMASIRLGDGRLAARRRA
jgi:outer membrane biosynthesis protein TonB